MYCILRFNAIIQKRFFVQKYTWISLFSSKISTTSSGRQKEIDTSGWLAWFLREPYQDVWQCFATAWSKKRNTLKEQLTQGFEKRWINLCQNHPVDAFVLALTESIPPRLKRLESTSHWSTLWKSILCLHFHTCDKFWSKGTRIGRRHTTQSKTRWRIIATQKLTNGPLVFPAFFDLPVQGNCGQTRFVSELVWSQVHHTCHWLDWAPYLTDVTCFYNTLKQEVKKLVLLPTDNLKKFVFQTITLILFRTYLWCFYTN